MPGKDPYMEKSKIVKVKDSKTGKITQLTKTGSTYTKAGNVVNLSETQKEIGPNKMKHEGPYNAHHPMKMKDSAYNMKSPYNMKPQILKHMSGK